MGPAARPVAIPDDVDAPQVEKASGRVELPLRVQWSRPRRSYDLSDPYDRMRVYEQVLREGTEEDVRWSIEVDVLIDLWDEMVLPPYVRQEWARWLVDHRGLSLAC